MKEPSRETMGGVTDRNPVFVVGNPKSGTSLVQALLDAHPALFVLPAELQFFKFPPLFSIPPGNMPPSPLPDWKVPIPCRDQDLSDLQREILESGELAALLRSGSPGRNIELPTTRFDHDRFLAAALDPSPEDLRDLYMILVRAFVAATDQGNGASPRRFAEKCPHMEEYAVVLKDWFPGARFVHVLRNPYANLFSLQKGLVRKRHLRDRILRPMAKSFYFLERNRRCLDDYHVVRYEDLVLDTDDTLKILAERVGIEHHPSLLSPTMLGRPWRGNPKSVDDELEGIDPRPVDAFRDRIAPLQVALINRFFGPFLEEHGYEKIDPGKVRPWLPMWLELPWHYVAHRWLWMRGGL